MPTIPAPVSWPPSSSWLGNDGQWNTFVIQVGTPPQDFHILPSTAGHETWIPTTGGCSNFQPAETCGKLRGALPFHGAQSSGFDHLESSTWQNVEQGLYTLDGQEAKLGYDVTGSFGFDTVTIGSGSGIFTQKRQVVAGYASPKFWLGLFGLGPRRSYFSKPFNNPIASYVADLNTTNEIPSLSWGYTAGASYRNQAPASLTLGGYDANRMESNGAVFSMSSNNEKPLQVGVQGILASNVASGGSGSEVSLLSAGIHGYLDSTVPHIWIPEADIDSWVSAFGLTYDSSTDYFLINDTMRDQNLKLQPTVEFQIGSLSPTDENANSITIQLPYGAFDLNVSAPIYNSTTHYFPIRKATSPSQYTIGRTFFQEAYIVADFENKNFTVAQAAFSNLDTQKLVAIQPSTVPPTHHHGSGLSGGDIAGIVCGSVAGVILIILGILFFMRRGKPKPAKGQPKELPDEEYRADEKRVSGTELPADDAYHELDGAPRSELSSPFIGQHQSWYSELSTDAKPAPAAELAADRESR